jgi:hypothetical protein
MTKTGLRSAAAAGVVLGGLVAVWTFVMGFSGMYRDPVLQAAFFLVVVIQIVVLVVLLRRTGPEHGYGAQVGLGTLASVVASPIVFGQSMLFTTVVFPTYFADLSASYEASLREAGVPDAEIGPLVADAAAAAGTSVSNALTGAVATIITGVVVSAITAAFVRKR